MGRSSCVIPAKSTRRVESDSPLATIAVATSTTVWAPTSPLSNAHFNSGIDMEVLSRMKDVGINWGTTLHLRTSWDDRDSVDCPSRHKHLMSEIRRTRG